MDTQDLIKKVRKIEIKTRGLTDQLFSGGYHSSFKGRGMSFSEVRDYTYGDDVRNIDWNVSARTGLPHVKVFEEERELTVVLMIDVSSSLNFGTRTVTKKETVAEVCAVLAFSAMNNNDKVGAVFFTDRVEAYLPPKKGRKNVLRIIREIIQLQPKGRGTDVGAALEYLNNVQRKKSIVFLLSDFVSPDFETPLRISSKRHDVIALNVYDVRERNVPSSGLWRLKDLETGSLSLIDFSFEGHRQAFTKFWSEHTESLSALLKKYGVDQCNIPAGEDYVKSLLLLFKNRAS